MTTRQYPGFLSYPAFVTQYSLADITPPTHGALRLEDTTSLFNLNGPPPFPLSPIPPTNTNNVPYILPGLPHNYQLCPNERLLMANMSSGGSALILPPDWGALPTATLADFKGITLQSVGDFARIRWTGALWSLIDTGGPSVAVTPLDQSTF